MERERNTSAARFARALVGAPAVELHARFSPDVLLQNARYTNIGEMFSGGFFNLARSLRALGEEETFLTGDGSDYEKFRALTQHFPHLFGSDAAYACRALLKTLFDLDLPLDAAHCDEIYTATARVLAEKPLYPRDVSAAAGVRAVAFPTDVTGDLSPFQKSKKEGMDVALLPIFDPSRLCSLSRGFHTDVALLEDRAGVKITDFSSFSDALLRVLDDFCGAGATMACHNIPPQLRFARPDAYHAGEIFRRAWQGDGKGITREEKDLFYAQMLRVLGAAYQKRGMTMQLLFGVEDAERAECPAPCPNVGEVAALLSYLDAANCLPRTLFFAADACEIGAFGTLFGTSPNEANEKNEPKRLFGGVLTPLADPASARAVWESVARTLPLGVCAGLTAGATSPLQLRFLPSLKDAFCDLVAQWCEKTGAWQSEEGLAEAEKTVVDVASHTAVRLCGLDL